MNDIIESGNFAAKNSDRYREIKYLSIDKSSKNNIVMMLRSVDSKVRRNQLNNKQKKNYFIELNKALFSYFVEVISGKKKINKSKEIISQANLRREVYEEFHLYQR